MNGLPRLCLLVGCLSWPTAGDCQAEIRAGAAEVEITPPVGLEIQHYFRISKGVHDPLYARCLYIEDDNGSSVAIICLDLIMGDFDACDSLREEVRQQTGVTNTLINFSHNHSSAALGSRGQSRVSNDDQSQWNDATLDRIVDIVSKAVLNAEPASLHVGRAPSMVGFNRRLLNPKTGNVEMQVNRDGPFVPWVNVLVARRIDEETPFGVLFETAAHPVIVPHTTQKISADFPGAAVKAVREQLGDGVIAMFAQGCGGNINGFPLRSSYENAVKQGKRLARSVLQAIDDSEPIGVDSFQIRSTRVQLPSHPLPTAAEVEQWIEDNQQDPARFARLAQLRDLVARGQQPPSRRFDVHAVSFGNRWCLTTMPHEMFCQYELWIDEHAPFDQTMTLAYTNGYEGYVAVDEAWTMEDKAGYEAASLPNWGGQVHTKHFGPPAVGCEQIIKDTIASLWPEPSAADPNDDQPAPTKPTEPAPDQPAPDQPAPIQPASDAPQPLSPSQSAARIRLPDGFDIELVASEPVVTEPSCIAFDSSGQIFVCELHGYNIEGHIDVGKLNKTGQLDKTVRRIRWELQGGAIAERAAELQYGVVKLVSDTDGDGVMDKAQVWADDLPPCYGIIPARGGVIVTCAPEIVFLADRDGDGVPEVREVLFTGFERRVMERGINNPRWGVDNWIYVGGGGEGGTITGPNLPGTVRLGNTDFRFKADGSAIEPVHGRVGTFGMTVNDVGDRFPASGGQPAIYALPLPYRYLARNPSVASPPTNHSAVNYNQGFRISQPHPWRVKRQQDPAWVKFYGARETNSNYFSGGCSNEYYGDSLFPSQFRGNLFYCEPSLNIVHRCVVTRDGAGYRGSRADENQSSEFLASTDQWFRPMNLRVGPEGALYIVDMYREIIEDYSAIPRFLQQQYGLDKGGDRGRIWRLIPEGKSELASQIRADSNFSRLSDQELAAMLKSTIRWKRQTAQRLLIERQATSVADDLRQLMRPELSGNTCIAALYTLDGLGLLQSRDVFAALSHDHYGVRMHGLRVSERWLDSDDALRAQVVSMVDADPSVRLQLAMTLGQSQHDDVVNALATLGNSHGDERWMDAAIVSSSRDRAGDLLAVLLNQGDVDDAPRHLLKPLATTLASQRDENAVARLLANLAGVQQRTQIEILNGLIEGFGTNPKPLAPAADGFAGLSRLLSSESESVRAAAAKLATLLPVAEQEQLRRIFADAAKTALDASLSVDQRRQSVGVLASAPFDTLAPVAMALLDSRQPPSLQIASAQALGMSTNPQVARLLLRRWASYTPIVRKAALSSVLARQDRLPALLDAVERGTVKANEIDALGREQLVANNNQDIAGRAVMLFSNRRADSDMQNRIGSFVDALAGQRNVDRGRQVFEKHCLACHVVDDRGHAVGPPLGPVVSKPDEAILNDMLDPSAQIDPQYRTYLVLTEDGRAFSGILVSESATSITLRKEKGATESVLRTDIETIRSTEVSLMPENLHELISPQETADLIAYMRKQFSR